MEFLNDLDKRPLNLPDNHGLTPDGLLIGNGPNALEVILVSGTSSIQRNTLNQVWRERKGYRAAPLLLYAQTGRKSVLIGPEGQDPPVYDDIDPEIAERLCRIALQEPDRHSAIRLLNTLLPDIETPTPGLLNQGLLATHELENGIPNRRDWTEACQRGIRARNNRGEDLLRSLGFELEQINNVTILSAGRTKTALAIFLRDSDAFELPGPLFADNSPVAYAIRRANEERLQYVVALRGSEIRLYAAKPGVGIGNKGLTETYLRIQLDLLSDEQAGYLWLLLSAEALVSGGTFEDILAKSKDFAAALSTRLRERVYKDVIPFLAEGIAGELRIDEPDAEDLSHLYHLAMTLLFRLLFIAYAEDQDLLPYRTNDLYKKRSLKETARGLLSQPPFGEDTGLWDDIWVLFTAVDRGRQDWGIPPYNGGLFSNTSENGKPTLEAIKLPSSIFGPALTSLLVDESPEGRGPVDFRSLGVREFGTIYEGLLESELSVADFDLIIDEDGQYLPAGENLFIDVSAGSIYLHNASGKRKSTGSYYTKSFAVDHLLDTALEPALDEHINRLDALGETRAANAFFDFRVADIAMGSGHFLVAAIDRIEARLSAYLTEHRLPEIETELSRLRETAQEAMRSVAVEVQIDNNQLLRRQIARHCIFGVDINPIAVELAKLSIWIHTFVPGLPLSLLDFNLITGNSLVGIATLEEVRQLLSVQVDSPQPSLFNFSADELLGDARESLKRFSQITDSTTREIAEAKQAFTEAKQALRTTEALFDIAAASRMNEAIRAQLREGIVTRWLTEELDLFDLAQYSQAQETFSSIKPLHFPLAFPQVFLRPRQGFDVILGNPPWDELKPEEHRFWFRYIPGIRGLHQRERDRLVAEIREQRPDLVAKFEEEQAYTLSLHHAVTTGDYPGIGTGDPDLYKAFVWRFWNLTSKNNGHIGVVLPRSAFAAKGSADFRRAIYNRGLIEDLTLLLNNQTWVFEDVHPQYTIGLVSIRKTSEEIEKAFPIRGPYRSYERFIEGVQSDPVIFKLDDILSWTDSAALPLLPSEDSAEVFAQLRKAPRLDLDDENEWRARPNRELDATNDKKYDGQDLMLFVENKPKGAWPIYKGESFDIWEADRGTETYYAWAMPELTKTRLQDKRIRGNKLSRSAFSEFEEEFIQDESTLPCETPRIAFRNITNRTNRRTMIVAMVPPHIFITNAAPYFLWPRGDELDEAYLLGVLSSIPLDWYARRFVEINMNFFILNPFPVPRPTRENPLWQRVVALAGRLGSPDHRYTKWAEKVGVSYGPLPNEIKEDMIHELDAVVAHLYELSENQLVHIFETFHENWDYYERLQATLVHYRNWEEKL